MSSLRSLAKTVGVCVALVAACSVVHGLGWLLGASMRQAVRIDQIGYQRAGEYDRVYRVGMACPCRCGCKHCPCVSEIWPLGKNSRPAP